MRGIIYSGWGERYPVAFCACGWEAGSGEVEAHVFYRDCNACCICDTSPITCQTGNGGGEGGGLE